MIGAAGIGFVVSIVARSPSTGCVAKNASIAFCSFAVIVGEAYAVKALPATSDGAINNDNPSAAALIIFFFPNFFILSISIK